MKRIIVFFTIIFFCFSSTAQFIQFAEGPVFPDPGAGTAKILLLKDNTTMFFHISFVKGIMVHVYEPKYRARTETNIEPAFGLLKEGNVEAIFEMNGNAVVMISSRTENGTSLYRLVIDGKTGELKDEKQIGVISKSKSKSSTAIPAGAAPSFHLFHDSVKEQYAVAKLDAFISDTAKRIEIILYGADHKELKRSSHSSPEKYQHLQFVDMASTSADNVIAIIYGYNIKQGETEGELMLAELQKTFSKLDVKELPSFSNDLVISNGIARYDEQRKQLLLLITAHVKSDSGKLGNFLISIDPASKQLQNSVPVNAGEKVDKKNEAISAKKYAGIAQNLFLNTDGYTIIFEEMERGQTTDTVTHFSLRNMAVAFYDYEGAVTSSFFIPVDHDIINAEIAPFHQARRNLMGQAFSGGNFLHGNQYKSGIFVGDGRSSFVLLNDIEANAMSGSGKVSTLNDVYRADAFYFKLQGNNITPKAGYVFGKPSEKDIHTPGVFSVFDYDRANNVLVTLRVESTGAHPGIQLVWLQPN